MHWPDSNEHWHSCHSSRKANGATIHGMKIEILLFDGFDDLDAFGPFEVLTGAGLDTRFVTIEPRETVRSSHGATIVPEGVLGDPDLVLVPGGGWNDRETGGVYLEARRGVIPAKLRERHAAGRRIGSVCTGAMMLAEAGILKGAPRSRTTARSRTSRPSAPTSRRACASSTTATS